MDFLFVPGDDQRLWFCSPWTVFQEKTFQKKSECFPKKSTFEPSWKGFQRSQLSNSVSADSLPVESAQCLRLGDPQTEFKMSTKPLLKFYCAHSSGKESAEKHYSNWLLWKSLLCGLFMKTFVFSSGMSSRCTSISSRIREFGWLCYVNDLLNKKHEKTGIYLVLLISAVLYREGFC